MKILVAPDFCPLGRVAEQFRKGKFNSVLGEIKPIIAEHDLAIVNLELAITSDKYKPIVKCGPNLQGDKSCVKALSYAGFNAVTLANNHVMDFGAKGYRDTEKYCEKYGIDSVGAGKNLRNASNVFYKEIEGKIIAIINCCEHEFSIATDDKPGTMPLDPVLQFYQLQEAKEKADYVMMIVHGGHEHFQLPSMRMKALYHYFIDLGADIVINHHQHCYSGYEIYHNKPIFYGLGNFCFDEGLGLQDSWYEGFCLSLDFKENKLHYKLLPYIQCKETPTIHLLEDTKQFDNAISELNAIIADDRKLQSAIEDNYSQLNKMYISVFEPYKGRVLGKLYYLGLLPSFVKKKVVGMINYIDCESHRDRLLYILKKINKL